MEFVDGNDGLIGIVLEGDSEAGRNLVRGNGAGGIFVSGTQHRVLNNVVGPIILGNPGATSAPSPGSGITLEGDGHFVGPDEPAEGGNYVTRFAGPGIELGTSDAAAASVAVISNSVEANGESGVIIVDAQGTSVHDNIISFNGKSGVDVLAGTGNDLSSNIFFSNGDLAIDLNGDGRTPNDTDDADQGPNNLQNSPELLSIKPAGSSQPSSFYRFEYRVVSEFASAYPIEVQFYVADSPASGEGESFEESELAFNSATQEFIGVLSKNFDGAIVAIATDADGNTSEFSAPFVVGVGPDVIFDDGFEDSGSL